MLKTLMTATAIGGLMVSTALAQAPAQQPAQQDRPAATQPAQPQTGQTQAQATSEAPKFIASQRPDQLLASRFRGTDVEGPDNQKVGDVNDVLFDTKGKVLGLVVGVGGFLGIGQKDVAIDLSAFQIVPADRDSGATTGSATTSPPAGGTTGAASGGEGMKGSVTDPNNIKLRVTWTKEQLEQAPSFERYKAPTTTGSGGTGGGAGGGGAKR